MSDARYGPVEGGTHSAREHVMKDGERGERSMRGGRKPRKAWEGR